MPERRRRQRLAAAAVLLAHGLLGWGVVTSLRTPPASRTPPPSAPARTAWLRLLPLPTPSPDRRPAAPLAPAADRLTATTTRRPLPAANPSTAVPIISAITSAITSPTPAVATPANPNAITTMPLPRSPDPSAQPATPPPPGASAPLDLRLPGGTAGAVGRRPTPTGAGLAREDLRARGLQTDRDARMAEALGTDTTLKLTALSDGSLRIQKGSSCTDVRPSRAQQLDAFNQSTHPLPRGAESCR